MAFEIDHSKSSPNHSSRNGRAISLVVIHATVGSFGSALNWLCSSASRVSSHYVISKAGHINQIVADGRAAWHAGASAWNGLDSDAIQDCSLGIELENLTGAELQGGVIHPADPYPALQLAAARDLVRSKMAEYRVPIKAVVRHLDIAIPKGRKTDPAGLDWPAFLASLAIDASPSPGRYRVRGVAVHEKADMTPPIALGGTAFLQSGEIVEIDEIKPGGIGHLRDGRGFVLLEQMEKMP